MKNYRIPRLAQELKKIFNITLTQKLNDPALAWVNVTEVTISKDLRYHLDSLRNKLQEHIL